MVFIKNMKLSKFLLEDDERPNAMVEVIRDYLEGKISAEDLVDEIPEIIEVKGKGALLEFDDYWDLFGLDDNTRWIVNAVTSSHGGYNDFFIDYDSQHTDWEEGWGFYWFTTPQKERLLNLMSNMIPEIKKGECSLEGETPCSKKITTFLDNEFGQYTANIVDSVVEERNNKISEEIEQELFKDYSIPLPRKILQMIPVKTRETFLVSLSHLINFIENYGTEIKDQSLTDIIKDVIYNEGYHPNYEDGFWEMGQDYDMEPVHRYIDRLLDAVEGEFEGRDFTSDQKYYKLLQDFKVTPGLWKKFPKGGQYDSFMIEKFDNETEKVDVMVTRPGEWRGERFRLPIEDVRNLLTNYTLF